MGEMRNRKMVEGIQKSNRNMSEVRPSLSVITLNINGLTFPIKRQGLADWIVQHGQTIYYLQATYFRSKDTNKLKENGCKKIFHTNSRYSTQKRDEVAKSISEK